MNDYIRLLLHGLLAVFVIIIIQFGINLFYNPNQDFMIVALINILVLVFFNVFYLNRIPEYSDTDAQWNIYASYSFLYLAFTLISLYFIWSKIGNVLSNNFKNFESLGFNRLTIVGYGVLFPYLYLKFRKYLKGIGGF